VNLTLGAEVLEEIIAHAKKAYPKEDCGVIAGFDVGRFIPMKNVADTETEFEMDPQELIRVLRDIRNSGQRLIAIYHSHPKGPARLSSKDIERAYYPDAAHLIVSLADPERPRVAAFRIIDAQPMEVEVHAIV